MLQLALGTDDVSIKITHCGVCYADVIWTRNQHGDSKYPVVPGHEIAGIVKEVGSNVQRFKVGDHMGVGTHVNSCRDCEYCNDSFNGVDVDGTIAKGGYSIVHEGYEFNISETIHWLRQPLYFVLELLFMLRCTSISKKEEALSQLGADNFVVSSDRNQMKVLVKSVDFIIDIAFGDHPFDPYMELLKTGGVRVLWWDSTVKSKSVLPTLILV
ncbi:PREDICTED: cinnamyl alcohol [Prunus dulcis]|uniref:PREDICTED: cinnamyl alcohol n=1 Tax=Prunus dulcis TaxID=3755 RepID=A0A5E4FM22_PRUDU|nr:PREDICTED: cinnamyl alcohol [Prunus dulcis]